MAVSRAPVTFSDLPDSAVEHIFQFFLLTKRSGADWPMGRALRSTLHSAAQPAQLPLPPLQHSWHIH